MLPVEQLRELYKIFAGLEDEREAELFFTDLLTPQELSSLSERWQVMRELSKGTPQREVAKKHGVSISKITRCSRVLQFGTGGVKKCMEKFPAVTAAAVVA